MKGYRGVLLAILFLLPLIAFLSQCKLFDAPPQDPRGQLYAGSSACINCHKKTYNDYLHTSHFSATQAADENTVTGPFNNGANTFSFSKDVKVVMEKRGRDLYQAAYLKGKLAEAHRFDITIGGVKAQTYLYWKGNTLYQLPISYFKALHSWTNSPGYDSTFADFSRPVTVGCLECHSSYIKAAKPLGADSLKNAEFDKKTFLTGIDCERCHGPAGDHVYYQASHPEEKQARYIITYASLTREQKINMCAVCHSGSKGVMLRSTFGFKPNDNLHDYKLEDVFQTTNVESLDVHGDQSRLLASSKCFMMTKMDCATCHDLHKSNENALTSYSLKCMSCHTKVNHSFTKASAQLNAALKTNCIDCHMPSKPSALISVGTHYIAVYNDESEKIFSALKQAGVK
jgi:hypothetical protein